MMTPLAKMMAVRVIVADNPNAVEAVKTEKQAA